MAANTKISWADNTFNPAWGCSKISPGCDNCYAEALDRRTGGDHWGLGKPRRRTSEKNWNEPRRWNRQAEKTGVRPKVFCASMADVFDNEWPPEWRADLWNLIRETPNLDWLLLTKRIGNVPNMIPIDWGNGWPHVWLGATVVNQEEADRDIPKLLAVPAAIRFLSIEPMLGPIDLSAYIGYNPSYEIKEPRAGSIRSREAGAVGNLPRRNAVEDSGTARQSLEYTKDIAASGAEKGGTQSGPIFSSATNDRRETDVLPCPPLGMAPLQRPDTDGAADQSQERGQEGQPPEESGNLHTKREHEARVPHRIKNANRADESSQQADRRANGSHPSDLFSRRNYASDVGGAVRGSIPDHIKDRAGREQGNERWTNSELHQQTQAQQRSPRSQNAAISLCIVGCESGPKRRPMNEDWVRSIRDQCAAAGTALFYKQNIVNGEKIECPMLDGRRHTAFPLRGER